MATRYLRMIWLLVATAGVAAAVTAVAPGSGPMPAAIHAEFESAVNFAGTPDCPVASGALLVQGRGIGTGTFGPFNRAIGTAAECSSGVFPGPGVAPPQLGTCHNIAPGQPYFDVHGKGTYMTSDGSVLYLVYHELSENPFIFGNPPFNLHDCGIWDVDPNLSTGIFHGATGHGQIEATVPVRADFSAHVSADYVGTITLVDGARAPVHPATVSCTGTMSGPITSGITVPNGGHCVLDTATVNGNVSVGKGGTLAMRYSIVGGNTDCILCSGANMAYSTVLGNFSVIGSPAGSSILSNLVTGNLSVLNSGPGTFTIGSNFVNGNLTFINNKGSSSITFNTVGGILGCQVNNPAPASSGNSAALKTGQCTS